MPRAFVFSLALAGAIEKSAAARLAMAVRSSSGCARASRLDHLDAVWSSRFSSLVEHRASSASVSPLAGPRIVPAVARIDDDPITTRPGLTRETRSRRAHWSMAVRARPHRSSMMAVPGAVVLIRVRA